MSLGDEIPNMVRMDRYVIESIAFAPDFSSIMVRYREADARPDDPVVQTIERVIDLLEVDEGRDLAWQIADRMCDLLDEAHKVWARTQRQRGS